MTGPAEVAAGVRFEIEIGFRTTPVAPGDKPVIVAGAPPELTFEVQADGFGFTFPEGNTRPLVVSRDRPMEASATLPVLADDVADPMLRSIEVQFSVGGGPVGLTYCDLTVHPAAADHETLSVEKAPGGGTAFGSAEGSVADLTVTITAEPGLPTVHWFFQSPHDVTRPRDQVTSELPEGSGAAFASQLMAQLPAKKGSAFLDNAVRGLGIPVANAMPIELWRTLAAVWGEVRDRTPTLQVITNEPYVPWELAWVEPDQKVSASLLPTDQNGNIRSNLTLGALWAVGRWVKPAPQPLGSPIPVCPPETSVDAGAMAVVIGDYTDTNGIGLLPEAVAEGNALALTYDAVSLGIDEASLTTLMDDTLMKGDQPYRPGVVHMAAHGKVGLNAQQYTGIVMKNKATLGPFEIQGSKLGKASRPFVFLNACQVGTASTVLNSYSGLASAFLVSGCRGFVAPLWDVDDDVAHRLSLDFYRAVLDEHVPVGEAVRRIRARFDTGDGTPTATPLAYVFYGHPDLQLCRG